MPRLIWVFARRTHFFWFCHIAAHISITVLFKPYHSNSLISAFHCPFFRPGRSFLPMSSWNLQTPFLSILLCCLLISSSVSLFFLLLSSSTAELLSPLERILRSAHTISAFAYSPWLRDNHALWMYTESCRSSPHSSQGLCRKCFISMVWILLLSSTVTVHVLRVLRG